MTLREQRDAKIQKDGAAARDLIADEARKLMEADETLTIQKARMQARKTLPDVVKQAEKRAGRAGLITTPTADADKPQTLGERIDQAVDKKAGWLSWQAGSGANGRPFHSMRRESLRNEVRQSSEYQKVRELYRSPLAKRPADAIRKSDGHGEALATVSEWLGE